MDLSRFITCPGFPQDAFTEHDLHFLSYFHILNLLLVLKFTLSLKQINPDKHIAMTVSAKRVTFDANVIFPPFHSLRKQNKSMILSMGMTS
jgi:uncharacterized protein YpbB